VKLKNADLYTYPSIFQKYFETLCKVVSPGDVKRHWFLNLITWVPDTLSPSKYCHFESNADASH